MDIFTKAFFMFADTKDPDPNVQLGLKTFEPVQFDPMFPSGTLTTNGPVLSVFVNSPKDTNALWANSVAFDFTRNSNDLTGTAIARLVKVTDSGPYKAFTIANETLDDPDLNVFLTPLVSRASPILANESLSDICYGPEAQAMAWTSVTPFDSLPVSVATVQQQPLESLPPDPSKALALTHGPSIIGWSPYELKYYVAGQVSGLPDKPTSGPVFAPPGIPDFDSLQFNIPNARGPSATRLMLLSADLSTGLQLEPPVAPQFTQVYAVNPDRSLSLVSQIFTSITCFGFSQTATAVGGSVNVTANGKTQAKAVICWRQTVTPGSLDAQANWTVVQLPANGTVTAMRFVGYAWYVATYDPVVPDGLTKPTSSMFFASLNFNAITFLDSWNANTNVSSYVSSIDAIVVNSKTCGPGLEPDPTNPATCVTKCPNGFVPFGSLCVQACPGPFKETSLPNECVPDSQTARLVTPTARGAAPSILDFKSGPPVGLTQQSSTTVTQIVSASFIAVLVCAVLLGFIFKVFLKK